MDLIASDQQQHSGENPEARFRILACSFCQRRKIKCEKQTPCSNCIKAQTSCVPGVANSRRRRDNNANLMERLSRCESLLERYLPSADRSNSMATIRHSPVQASALKNCTGRIVDENGLLSYMDQNLLSTIHEELRTMSRSLSDQESDHFPGDPKQPDHEGHALFLGPISVPVEYPWLRADRALFLWQIFLSRFNPLTKVIHTPSLEPYALRAGTSSHNLPTDIEALLFSIYSVAVTTLSSEECKDRLGLSKGDAIRHFSFSSRQALSKLDFLNTRNLHTLQALFLYLLSLQGRSSHQTLWTLGGIIVRIAQKMGLHKDGQNLGLSPFETEMRRRIWWQIMTVETWFSMFSDMRNSPQTDWDARPPLNLDDEDLQTSEQLVRSKVGPTDMIFCLINNKITEFLLQNPGLENPMRHSPGKQSARSTEHLIKDLDNDLQEIVNNFCDPLAGDVHGLALELKSQMIQKLRILTTAPSAFEMIVLMAEMDTDSHSVPRSHHFHWYSLLTFHPEFLLYMATQISSSPPSELVERAWNQLHLNFERHPELLDISNPVFSRIGGQILRAWQMRQASSTGVAQTAPSFIRDLQDVMASSNDIEGFPHTRAQGSELETDRNEPISSLLSEGLPGSIDFGRLDFGLAPAEW
ncbi:fungal-specific transcription factor domain-containing protein [Xylaria curta]|nr:fungal-specific transcription factor domain-containing protein [Xylaria curta]